MELKSDILQAAMICVNPKEIRKYIAGVRIDDSGWLVSTDGHRMFAARINVGEGVASATIPADAVSQALKCKTSFIEYKIRDSGHWLVAGDMEIFFKPIDLDYPNWKSSVPPSHGFETQTPAKFNGKYYQSLEKIEKIVGGEFVLFQNRSGPCGVRFSGRDDCLAVIMPMRDPKDAPKWSGIDL